MRVLLSCLMLTMRYPVVVYLQARYLPASRGQRRLEGHPVGRRSRRSQRVQAKALPGRAQHLPMRPMRAVYSLSSLYLAARLGWIRGVMMVPVASGLTVDDP